MDEKQKFVVETFDVGTFSIYWPKSVKLHKSSYGIHHKDGTIETVATEFPLTEGIHYDNIHGKGVAEVSLLDNGAVEARGAIYVELNDTQGHGYPHKLILDPLFNRSRRALEKFIGWSNGWDNFDKCSSDGFVSALPIAQERYREKLIPFSGKIFDLKYRRYPDSIGFKVAVKTGMIDGIETYGCVDFKSIHHHDYNRLAVHIGDPYRVFNEVPMDAATVREILRREQAGRGPSVTIEDFVRDTIKLKLSQE